VTITDEAVLLIAFNRPDHLATLIERLRVVSPTRIYLAVDGPRADRAGELERVQACRDLAASINWACEVQTLFQEDNLGCGLGVSTAITWFFTHEERGIILEDDIVPDPSFFPFCTELLDRYQDDTRVFAISGCNFVPPEEMKSQGAYRFSMIPHIWGWATWRRSWEQHRLDIAGWRRDLPPQRLWARSGHSMTGALYWAATFELLARKEVDTWDGQFVYASMVSNQWTAISNVNLVENLGFGPDATHTVDAMHIRSVEPIVLPTQPVPVVMDNKADAWTRKHHFRVSLLGLVHQSAKYVQQRRRRTT
jgi:hypothetical protein